MPRRPCYNPVEFEGHSLRAGFLIEAEATSVSIFKMREVSRRKWVEVVAACARNR